MMSQCRLTDCNKCPTLLGDIGRGGGRVGGAGNIWELPVLPIQCFCEPNTALKKKSLFYFLKFCSVAGLLPATRGYQAFEKCPVHTGF